MLSTNSTPVIIKVKWFLLTSGLFNSNGTDSSMSIFRWPGATLVPKDRGLDPEKGLLSGLYCTRWVNTWFSVVGIHIKVTQIFILLSPYHWPFPDYHTTITRQRTTSTIIVSTQVEHLSGTRHLKHMKRHIYSMTLIIYGPFGPVLRTWTLGLPSPPTLPS